MKRTIYNNCTILIVLGILMDATVASEITQSSNIQHVKRQIELNVIKSASDNYRNNASKEVRIIDDVSMDVLNTGIEAIGNSACSLDLKFMLNGLKTRTPWAISSMN